MANTFPKRWTDTFQMRCAPEFKDDLQMIAIQWGEPDLTGAEVVRALVDREAERIKKAKPKRTRS